MIDFSKFITNRIANIKVIKHWSVILVFLAGVLSLSYVSITLVTIPPHNPMLSLVFFGLGTLFFISIYIEIVGSLKKEVKQLSRDFARANDKLSRIELEVRESQRYIASLGSIKQRPGFVYIMRRDDGIIKIGRSANTDKRLKQHETDYNQKFAVVQTFIAPDAITFEALALSMTAHRAFHEPRRNELRLMGDRELAEFISLFATICKESVTLARGHYVIP